MQKALLGLVSAVVVVGALAPLSHAQTADHSPAGEILIVTTNLQEAWDTNGDMRDMSEMERYVDRLLDQTPYVPDVLLLQEVRLKSAKRVAELLTDRTGEGYTFAVKPPRRPWTQNPQRRTETETAILMNSEAMSKLDKGGYIALTYERKHAADKSIRVETTRHARVALEELDGGARFAAASVHLQYGRLASKDLDYKYQEKWTTQIARVLNKRYSQAIRSIGGDFNENRCRDTSQGARECKKSPFWTNLTQDPWNYQDVMYERFLAGDRGMGLGGVDFIFSTGSPIRAGSDLSYDKTDPNQFYSDHRFFWAVVGT